jgi:hypothetical protein
MTPDHSVPATMLEEDDSSILSSPVESIIVVEESVRERALREAHQCLEHLNDFQLDGFNLLGVVQNPRTGGSIYHHRTSSHLPQQQLQQQAVAATAAAATTSSLSLPGTNGGETAAGTSLSSDTAATTAPAEEALTDYFSDKLEATLLQVAEQIQMLNMFLEELSIQYLGDDSQEFVNLEYYLQHEDQEAPPIPSQLANLQLHSLQTYLENCGVLAHSFVSTPLPVLHAAASNEILSSSEVMEEFTDLPDVLLQQEFDLTDPETFCNLLLEDAFATRITKQTTTAHDSLYQPTFQLVRLQSPDMLSGHLDKVELALLHQVRQKSGAFFQETTRFRQLQVGIVALLEQTQALRKLVQQMKRSYSTVADIPALDAQRTDLGRLLHILDGISELVRVKASIGGLVSANDHLGAAEQIQYGRQLLTGRQEDGEDEIIEFHQLQALDTCGEQFQQYQSLVVQNLSEELTEVFLNWKQYGGRDSRVQEMVQALSLCNALESTGELYVRRVQQVIRMTVRTTIAEFVDSSGGGVTGMTYTAFSNCLLMLLEELSVILQTALSVDQYCVSNQIFGNAQGDGKEKETFEQTSGFREAVTTSAELASKSIAELLRLRKEAHSLLSLEEMKQLWDTGLKFTIKVEEVSNTRAVGLRSTLLGQAKAFLERTHESNMAALVAALDSERWMQCEVRIPSCRDIICFILFQRQLHLFCPWSL